MMTIVTTPMDAIKVVLVYAGGWSNPFFKIIEIDGARSVRVLNTEKGRGGTTVRVGRIVNNAQVTELNTRVRVVVQKGDSLLERMMDEHKQIENENESSSRNTR